MVKPNVDEFKYWIQKTVDAFSKKLQKEQAGYLDREIGRKAPQVDVYVNYQLVKKCPYNLYWLEILPEGQITNENDDFISSQKGVHLSNLEIINDYIQSEKIGDLLYYTFIVDKKRITNKEVRIEGFVRVFNPIDENIKNILLQLQSYIDQTPNHYGARWVARITPFDVENYLDEMQKTMKNKYNELFGVK